VLDELPFQAALKRKDMMKLGLLVLTVCAFQSLAIGQQEATTETGEKVYLWEDGTWVYADSLVVHSVKTVALANLQIPKTDPNQIVITHNGFALLYSEAHEQASWVAYELTREETNKKYERTDKFIVDQKVKTGTASDKDYAGSGYDRGHLAPASDMGWSATAMAESFYYSNMSPQTPSFNRGVWKRLEALVRTWAIDSYSVYIVTGPVLTSGLPSIGPNGVSVPNYYYKVILDYNEPSIKGIAFVIPNTGSKDPLQQFAVSIDNVEKLTGIDFFPSLPDDEEGLIEETLCIECWSWQSIETTSDTEEISSSVSAQCNGKTKAGDRCKNKTLNPSGYCYLHEGQQSIQTKTETQATGAPPTSTSVQCSGTTKAGSRCKHMTYSPNGRCYQHGGN
jgi:endonuclease G, mitochondrial